MSRLDKTITVEEILFNTNGGKQIFEKELGCIPRKAINSPLRNDKNPSFSVFLANNGLWMYKDFSNDDAGTAIQFVQKRYNLSFKEALEYVQRENNINFNTNSNINNIINRIKCTSTSRRVGDYDDAYCGDGDDDNADCYGDTRHRRPSPSL
jgi:hypothetical protein